MGDIVLDSWEEESSRMIVADKSGILTEVEELDVLATKWSDRKGIAVAIVNKHGSQSRNIQLNLEDWEGQAVLFTLNGESVDTYNDVDRQRIKIRKTELGNRGKIISIEVEPHSVNVLWKR